MPREKPLTKYKKTANNGILISNALSIAMETDKKL